MNDEDQKALDAFLDGIVRREHRHLWERDINMLSSGWRAAIQHRDKLASREEAKVEMVVV